MVVLVQKLQSLKILGLKIKHTLTSSIACSLTSSIYRMYFVDLMEIQICAKLVYAIQKSRKRNS